MKKFKFRYIIGFLSALVLFACSDDEPDAPEPTPAPDENQYVDLESFDVEIAQPLEFTDPGEFKSVIVTILPQSLSFNSNANDSLCSLKLNFERGANALNNGSFPVEIKEIKPLSDSSGNPIAGKYEVRLADTGYNIFPYSEKAYFSLDYKNSKGVNLTAYSVSFRIDYISEKPIILDTGLPIVVIDIPDNTEITSKTEWKAGINITIYDENGNIDYQDEQLQMKGRGNNTWGYPKKPYALKLNKKEKILGMSKHKRWCLLANYIDRTLIRNAVAFEISGMTDLAYTPSGKFVELIVNGTHRGNYYLTEQIKVDKNRVDITDPDDEDLPKEGDFNTRGYILELDTYFDEVNKFRSSVFNLPYMFKDPDEVWQSEIDYIAKYVTAMEKEIDKIGSETSNYRDYIDIGSFADWWIVNELMTNSEATHPKSSYMTKDVDGKIFMGPVWDFDWGTLLASKKSSFVVKNAIYYKKLFQDPIFVEEVKARFAAYMPQFEMIPQFIDDLREQLRKSCAINYRMWPYTDVPNYDSSDYDSAFNNLKKNYTDRLNWLSQQIANL